MTTSKNYQEMSREDLNALLEEMASSIAYTTRWISREKDAAIVARCQAKVTLWKAERRAILKALRNLGAY